MIKGSTLIVYHDILPPFQKRYEEWLNTIIKAAAKFPGHVGVTIVKPPVGGTRYSIAVKFTADEHAMNWQRSTTREGLLKEAKPYMACEERVAIATGIDNWFQIDAPAQFQPKRYKQWLLTTLVIWTLTMLVPAILEPLFTLLPVLDTFGIRHFITAAIIVGLVIYLIMPRVSKALSTWLQKH